MAAAETDKILCDFEWILGMFLSVASKLVFSTAMAVSLNSCRRLGGLVYGLAMIGSDRVNLKLRGAESYLLDL